MNRKLLTVAAGGLVLAAAVLGLAVADARGAWGGFFGHAPAGFNDTNGQVTGRGVNFTLDAATATLTNLDPTNPNASHPLVSRIQLALPAGATATGTARGPLYVVDDAVGDRLVVMDGLRGAFATTSVNGTTVTLTFPEGANVTAHDAVAHWSPAGATIVYANGQVATLRVSPNATVAQSGQTLTVTLPAHGALAFTAGGGHGGFGGRGFGLRHEGFGPRGFPHHERGAWR